MGYEELIVKLEIYYGESNWRDIDKEELMDTYEHYSHMPDELALSLVEDWALSQDKCSTQE